MHANRLAIVAAALVAALLVLAWVDGGREPVRAIEEPVALPGAAR